MRHLLTIVFILTAFAFAVIGQPKKESHISIAGTKFPCTESLAFISPTDTNTSYGMVLSVAFAKDNNRGLVVFRKQAKGVDQLRPSISGSIKINLDSGGQIVLVDNGLHDFKDEVIYAAYYITEGDMVKLKNSNIRYIEYTETDYTGKSMDLIAENRTYIVEAVNGYEMTVERYNIPDFLVKFW